MRPQRLYIRVVEGYRQKFRVFSGKAISKAGNRRIRTLMIQIAWGWLRYQPHSALSVWFNTRFALGGKRMRRIGIVALARRLLIALWWYVQSGTIPESASLKPLSPDGEECRGAPTSVFAVLHGV